jgi:GDPmannose 4,6-dehydratase
LETTRRLGWEARVRFRERVRLMVDADLDAARPLAHGEGVRLVAERGPLWLGRP